MILTCPSCRAQFVVNPNALGENGRTVRCGKCKHEWLAKRPLITMPPENLVTFEHAPVNDAQRPSSAPEVQSGLRVDSVASVTPTNLPAFSAEVQPIATRNAIIAAVIVAGLLSIPVFMLNHHGDAAPQVKPAEHVVEKPAEAPKVEKKEEKGIALDGTPTTLLKEEMGRTILSIEGTLINKTNEKQLVPVLQAQALNAKGKVVKEWTIPVSNKEMEPGQRQGFSYSMPFNEQGVVDIAFHFL